MIAGSIQKQAGNGEADGSEEAGVAGIEAVVGAIGRPANENPGGNPEKLARGAPGRKNFNGWIGNGKERLLAGR